MIDIDTLTILPGHFPFNKKYKDNILFFKMRIASHARWDMRNTNFLEFYEKELYGKPYMEIVLLSTADRYNLASFKICGHCGSLCDKRMTHTPIISKCCMCKRLKTNSCGLH